MPMQVMDSMGMAFYYYDCYAKEIEKAGKKPVSFIKFLVGKR